MDAQQKNDALEQLATAIRAEILERIGALGDTERHRTVAQLMIGMAWGIRMVLKAMESSEDASRQLDDPNAAKYIVDTLFTTVDAYAEMVVAARFASKDELENARVAARTILDNAKREHQPTTEA